MLRLTSLLNWLRGAHLYNLVYLVAVRTSAAALVEKVIVGLICLGLLLLLLFYRSSLLELL